MKKLFLFLCLSVITLSLFAQHGNQRGNQYGTLTISSTNNQRFWLFIDDVLQNEYSTSSIRIQGLQLIYYKVRVEMDNPSFNCVGESVLIYNTPNNNYYAITLERGNFYSFKKTQTDFNPYLVQNLILPDYNYYSAYNQFLFSGSNSNVNQGHGNQSKGNAYKKNQYNTQSNNQGHGGSQGHGNSQSQGHGNPPPPPPSPPPAPAPIPAPQAECMSSSDFSKALSIIQKESFDSSKLSVAKQMTSSNKLSVSQIMQICGLFSSDNDKLEYAKYAYRFCIDQNNYYQLNEVFRFTSSKDELRKFIGN